MNKIDKLKSLLEVLNNDYAPSSEVAQVVTAIMDYIKKSKSEHDQKVSSLKGEIVTLISNRDTMSKRDMNRAIQGISKTIDKLTSDTDTKIGTIESKLVKLLSRLRSDTEYIRDDLVEYINRRVDSIRLTPHIEPTPKTVVVTESGDNIVDKVNKSNKKIDKNKISGIEDIERMIRHIAALPQTTSFINGKRAKNINIVGATVTIMDDTAYVTGIGSSGGGDNVVNEVVSGSGTSWTLAGTPTDSSKVKLYVNGQRLIPTVDYSISGAAITTVLSWSSGTLLADYSTT